MRCSYCTICEARAITSWLDRSNLALEPLVVAAAENLFLFIPVDTPVLPPPLSYKLLSYPSLPSGKFLLFVPIFDHDRLLLPNIALFFGGNKCPVVDVC